MKTHPPRPESPTSAAFDEWIEATTSRNPGNPSGGPRAWASFTSVAGSYLALASTADAAVVYSGLRNQSLTMPAVPTRTFPLTGPVLGPGRATLALDLDGGGDDLVLSATFLAHSTQLPSGTLQSTAFQRLGGLGVGGAVVDAIATGWISGWMQNHVPGEPIEIGPTAFYPNPGILFQRTSIAMDSVPTYTVDRGYFVPSSTPGGGGTRTGFAGFQLGNGNVGWIRLRIEQTGGWPSRVTAIDWAWEDSGGPINAGEGLPPEIPEGPTHLALLTLGAAGVLAYRRRRSMENQGSAV